MKRLINEVENDAAKTFVETHKCKNGKTPSIYFMKLSTKNGIGLSVEIKCKKCGKKANITDYKTW